MPFYIWVHDSSSPSRANPRSIARDLWRAVGANTCALVFESKSSSKRAVNPPPSKNKEKKGKKGKKEKKRKKGNDFKEREEACGRRGTDGAGDSESQPPSPQFRVEAVVAVIYAFQEEEHWGRNGLLSCWLAMGRSLVSDDRTGLLAQLVGEIKAREV